jgi:hypothetical protein
MPDEREICRRTNPLLNVPVSRKPARFAQRSSAQPSAVEQVSERASLSPPGPSLKKTIDFVASEGYLS